MVRVKICGITSLPDALAAAAAGADALGFVFHRPSPRYVAPEQARAICHALPPFAIRVGVFVDSPLAFVQETLARCRLDYAQLHGGEDADFCAALHGRAVKCLRVGRDDIAKALDAFPAAAFLLDTFHPGLPGGTGEQFDWDIAREAARGGKPIIISGGLRPENVAQAIAVAQPYAVDVASGVEAAPGIKDHAKMRAFIAAARG